MIEKELWVKGMTCASCSQTVEKQSASWRGSQPAVNLATEKLHIHDEQQLTEETLCCGQRFHNPYRTTHSGMTCASCAQTEKAVQKLVGVEQAPSIWQQKTDGQLSTRSVTAAKIAVAVKEAG